MASKKILFTAPATYTPDVSYAVGHIETMREDMAFRWIKRGVATDDADAIAAAERAALPPAAIVPEAPAVRVDLDPPPAETPPARSTRRTSAS